MKFEFLPLEIKLKIFGYLERRDQIVLTQVNKEWQQLLNDKFVWQVHWQNFFYEPMPSSIENVETYREIFYFYKKTVTDVVNKFHLLLNLAFFNKSAFFENREELLKSIEKLINTFKVTFCEIVHQFLKLYPDVNKPYTLGYTLLHMAVALTNSAAVNYLIKEREALVNVEDDRGYKPLAIAIELCPICRDIIKENVFVQAKDDAEMIIITLVENGADLNCVESTTELNALDYATLQKNQIAIDVLNNALHTKASPKLTYKK